MKWNEILGVLFSVKTLSVTHISEPQQSQLSQFTHTVVGWSRLQEDLDQTDFFTSQQCSHDNHLKDKVVPSNIQLNSRKRISKSSSDYQQLLTVCPQEPTLNTDFLIVSAFRREHGSAAECCSKWWAGRDLEGKYNDKPMKAILLHVTRGRMHINCIRWRVGEAVGCEAAM